MRFPGVKRLAVLPWRGLGWGCKGWGCGEGSRVGVCVCLPAFPSLPERVLVPQVPQGLLGT